MSDSVSFAVNIPLDVLTLVRAHATDEEIVNELRTAALDRLHELAYGARTLEVMRGFPWPAPLEFYIDRDARLWTTWNRVAKRAGVSNPTHEGPKNKRKVRAFGAPIFAVPVVDVIEYLRARKVKQAEASATAVELVQALAKYNAER